MNNDLEILTEQVYEFDYEEQDFVVYYDGNAWIARHNNQDLYDYEIIIDGEYEDQKYEFKDEYILLFDKFIFTQIEFKELKNLVNRGIIQ